MTRRLGRLLQRTSPGTVLTALALLLVAALLFIPVPYVVLGPGPTADTLGTDDKTNQPLITVQGRETFPTEGGLRLTTVGVQGKPGSLPPLLALTWSEGRIAWGGALVGWGEDGSAVVPVEAVYDPKQTADQTEEQNRADMLQSQANAKAAAMRALKVPVTAVVVDDVIQGAPAAGKLKVGDELLAVDGERVRTAQEVRDAVTRRQPGQELVVKVQRTPAGGRPAELDVPITGARSADGQARTIIGIVPVERYPFAVDIRIEDIGGPSAGLMFALGIVDKLTPGSLTNGAVVAGTGSIDADGLVGPIGGIAQKLAGARKAGATVFLTPERNCEAAVHVVPDGLRLVKVTALDDALASMETLRTGSADVPSCAGS